jgi:hypothetical protein
MSAALTLFRCKDCIFVFMDSPRSGARHRALAIVDSVCVELDYVHRADHTTLDKFRFFLYQESIIIYFCRTRHSGAALCKQLYRSSTTRLGRVDSGPPHQLHLRHVDSGPPHQLHLRCIDTSPPRRHQSAASSVIIRHDDSGPPHRIQASITSTPGYGSRQQTPKILRASPSASTL